MLGRLAGPALLTLLLGAPAAVAQQILSLPTGTWANDVTPDGEVVVGTALDGCFVWRWRHEAQPTYITGCSDIVAVSDDGRVLAGNMIDPLSGKQVAARWTEADGWQSLGGFDSCDYLTSAAYDMSGDGSTVVGLAWDGCDGRGFRWTAATGMQLLEGLINGNNRATAISGDGSTIAGFAQGLFNRTPAWWQPDLSGAVTDPAITGEVYGLSEDGSVAVGTRVFGTTTSTAFLQVGSGPMVDMGSLYPTWNGHASDISEDGNVIVGFDSNSLARDAWVWTSATGIVSLEATLSALGIPNVPDLQVCRKVSSDGRVIVGGQTTVGGPFGYGAFIAELSTAQPTWTNLAGGTPGQAGVPRLTGQGTLQGHTPVDLRLEDARPSALALLWITSAASPLTIFGGTLHAFPAEGEVLLATDDNGAFHGSTTWPTGIAAGSEIVFQFLVDDPAATPWGINLSNGLLGLTP